MSRENFNAENIYGKEDSNEDVVVVQCPQCKARFAIQTSIIESYDNQPRFHCPQCDSIFDYLDANISEFTNNNREAADQENEEIPELDHTPTQSVARPNIDWDKLKSDADARFESSNFDTPENGVSTDDSFDPFADPDDPDDEPYHYKPVSSLTLHEVPKDADEQADEVWNAHESQLAEQDVVKVNDIASSIDKLDNKEEAPQTGHKKSISAGGFVFSHDKTDDDESMFNVKEASSSKTSEMAQSIKHSLGSLFHCGKKATPSKSIEPPQENSAPRSEPQVNYSNHSSAFWSGCTKIACITAPMLLLVIGLYLVGVQVTSSNQVSIFRAFLPTAPQYPPTDLIISNLKIKYTPLDSGVIAHLISGSIQNNNSKSFTDITLEGLAFDASGTSIVRKQINAASSLSDTKLESFTPEDIENLQSSKRLTKYELEPGTSKKFTIALISDDMRNAEYFSARIYSAQ